MWPHIQINSFTFYYCSLHNCVYHTTHTTYCTVQYFINIFNTTLLHYVLCTAVTNYIHTCMYVVVTNTTSSNTYSTV